MMAHAVIPHFHHDGTLCFSQEGVTYLTGNPHEHDRSCSSQQDKKHHHHDHGKLENCDLKDVLLRQDNQLDRSIPHPDILDLFSSLNSFDNSYLNPYLFERYFEQKPYLNSYQLAFTGYSSNLRSPPVFLLLA